MNMSQLSSTVARVRPTVKPKTGSQIPSHHTQDLHAEFGFSNNDDAFIPSSSSKLSLEECRNNLDDLATTIINSSAEAVNLKPTSRNQQNSSNGGFASKTHTMQRLTTDDDTRPSAVFMSAAGTNIDNSIVASLDLADQQQQHGDFQQQQASRARRRLLQQQGQPLDISNDERESAARQKELIEAKRLRRRLKFFFLNPVEKFRTRGQFPYKLFMQLVKVFFVTAQLLFFGDMRYQYVNFLRQNKLAFGKMLLQNWTESYDPEFVVGPIPYQYAIETYDQFYNSINYAVINYRHIGRDALGTYDYGDANEFSNQTYSGGDNDDNDTSGLSPPVVPPMQFCKYFYTEAHLYPNNSTYILNTTTETQCIFLKVDNVHNDFDSRTYFHDHNFTINFDTIINARLMAVLRTVHVRRDFDPYQRPPVCYKLEVRISFDNSGHCGRIPVTISLTPESMNCKGSASSNDASGSHTIVTTIFDIVVLIICCFSLLLCVRAVIRSMTLQRFTSKFMLIYLNYKMPLSERIEFMNGWYIMICVNDIMILLGTFIKLVIQSDYRAKTTSDYDQCGILLGIGNLFVWCGVLRYLTFFKKYNILLLTLKRAMPNVVRFMVCALCIFLGFSFCGWLVFGPYHYKFHSWASSCEVLFAEINGDDMYTTFAMIGDQVSSSVWFSFRIYLYLFICLFTYVVLSLFISLIMEAYETVKDYQKNGQPMSPLHSFIWHGLPPDADNICDDDVGNVVYVRSRLPSFSAADEQAAHEAVIEQTRRKRRARAEQMRLPGRVWYRLSRSRLARFVCRDDDWDSSDREDLQPQQQQQQQQSPSPPMQHRQQQQQQQSLNDVNLLDNNNTNTPMPTSSSATGINNGGSGGSERPVAFSRRHDALSVTSLATTTNTVPHDGFPALSRPETASPTHYNNYGTLG